MANPAECRILVISVKPESAEQFIQRVQALSDPKASSCDISGNVVPWTIVNKYYTANVHFEIRLAQDFRPSYAEGVPAVVYVWQQGDPLREQILDIHSSLKHHDPDVALAVKFGSSATTSGDDTECTDEFLSSHGFEYIEGDRDSQRSTQDGERLSDDEDSGIPGLPRVIDALSTIMWPSIVQSNSTRNRASRARELIGWAREEEEEDGLRALISDSIGASDSTGELRPGIGDAKKSRMQREMEELEKWLEEEDDKRELEDAQAWTTSGRDLNSGAWQDIPTPTINTPTVEGRDFSGLGFDDDFTEFVSAPSPRSPGSLNADRLVPMHTGASYRSLASVSDFGGDGLLFMSSPSEDVEDSDLPSQAEIAETSRRIFGSSVPLPIPDISRPSESSQTLSSSDSGDEHHSFEHRDDDDDFEMSAFDLSRVLSALQGMKEEISGMEDEGERRKAAARVALGLVYGLQTDRDN